MKYIKLNSVTWWASVAPLSAGLFLAIAPLWAETAEIVAVVKSLTGSVPPAVLINAGLAGIGIRGAMD
jgi:hypothetical protein